MSDEKRPQPDVDSEAPTVKPTDDPQYDEAAQQEAEKRGPRPSDLPASILDAVEVYGGTITTRPVIPGVGGAGGANGGRGSGGVVVGAVGGNGGPGPWSFAVGAGGGNGRPRFERVDYEYGIRHELQDEDKPFRAGLTREEANEWMEGVPEDVRRESFRIVARPRGAWRDIT